MAMDIDQILVLAKAGYTAEEINGMMGEAQKPADTGDAQKPTDTGDAQNSAAPTEPGKVSQQILSELAAMRKALESSNIAATAQPQKSDVNEILASIISPKLD